MSEWISVKDQLPNDDSDVLVYHSHDFHISVGNYNVNLVSFYVEEDGAKFYTCDGWDSEIPWAQKGLSPTGCRFLNLLKGMGMNPVNPDFIKRATELAEAQIEECPFEERRNKINLWNKQNQETLKRCRKEYEISEKGKKALSRRSKRREERMRKACFGLSEKDLKDVRMFYVNCPEGYEVDHIKPLAAGGNHHVSNLQYLTPTQHKEKHSQLIGMGRRAEEFRYVKE